MAIAEPLVMKSNPATTFGTGLAALLAFTAGAVLATTSIQRWIQKRGRGGLAVQDAVDEAVDESFPASDPPSHSATLGATPPR
jgi:hypothetical protein